MPSQNGTTPYEVLKRRPVGKAAWRTTIHELLESERSDLVKLKQLRHRFHNDPTALALLIELHEEKSQRLHDLQSLLHYKG